MMRPITATSAASGDKIHWEKENNFIRKITAWRREDERRWGGAGSVLLRSRSSSVRISSLSLNFVTCQTGEAVWCHYLWWRWSGSVSVVSCLLQQSTAVSFRQEEEDDGRFVSFIMMWLVTQSVLLIHFWWVLCMNSFLYGSSLQLPSFCQAVCVCVYQLINYWSVRIR